MKNFKFVFFVIVLMLIFVSCNSPTNDYFFAEAERRILSATKGSAEDKVIKLVRAVHYYLENEDYFSESARNRLAVTVGRLSEDRSLFETDYFDYSIRVDQMAGVMLAFLGDARGKNLFEGVPRNTAFFPDMCDYALLWLGDIKSIDAIYDRMYESQMRTLRIMPLMDATIIEMANPRLIEMKERISDKDKLNKINKILEYHKKRCPSEK